MDGLQEVQIEPLRGELLNDVIGIHRAGLGYTLNSRLGKKHLAFLYQAMQADPDCYVGVALAGGRPVGVISGTVNAQHLRSRLARSIAISRLVGIAIGLVVQPSLIVEWIKESIIASPVSYEGTPVAAVLTTIAVDTNIQSRGVGRHLVIALERFFSRSGVKSYRLETLIKNTRARAFYGALGFEEVGKRAGSYVLVKGVGQ